MIRGWWVIVIGLVPGPVPAAVEQIGSFRIQGGMSASGPSLAGASSLRAHFGDFSAGLELGAAGLGNDEHVWHAGGVFAFGSTTEGIRPRATLGVAYYSLAPGGDLLGMSLGAGVWRIRPALGLSPGAELRWHFQLQDIGRDKDLSFVTLTVGVAANW